MVAGKTKDHSRAKVAVSEGDGTASIEIADERRWSCPTRFICIIDTIANEMHYQKKFKMEKSNSRF